MDYKKKYKEALERANTAHKDDDRHLKATLERIFPELKESDDERIRKGIIRNLEYLMDKSQGFVKEELSERIAWLENQANQKSILNVPSREIILSIWDLGNEWKELTGGCISTEYGTQLDYIQKHWNESEYYLRETQGEQETDFKFELNFDFNVGQWIVACGKQVFLITKIDGFNITLVDTNGDEYVFDVDSLKDAHLWTIQDAKHGDYLTVNGRPFIYCCFDDYQGNYCCIDFDGVFRTSFDFGFNGKTILPATKEQRDILFSKMKEAGYEWNAEKKEIKKIGDEPKNYKQQVMSEMTDLVKDYIKQKSSWSEEDEKNLQGIIDEIEANKNEAPSYDLSTYDKYLNWLKSLKNKIKNE